MRILINGLAAAGVRTGVGHYTAELVHGLQAIAGADDVVCFQPDWARTLKRNWTRLRGWMQPASRTRSVAGPPTRSWPHHLLDSFKRVGLWMYEQRFRALSRRGFDLYHEPNFIPLASRLPTVTTVLDLSVLLHPQWHPADRVMDFERRFHAGLKQCAHVIAISDHCRREAIDGLGLAPHIVSRTYMGVRSHFRPLSADTVRERLEALNLPPSYLLHVGTIEPRKNLMTLLRAYCDLPSELRDRCPLVLVGGWGWNSADVHHFLQSTAKDRNVRHVGYVAEDDLPAVYNGARALVFPTHYEGFGMPTVEMMACGGAVIASTAAAVAEVVAGRGYLVDPLDVQGWRDAMARIIQDNDWHAAMCEGGPAFAARFTWERCAADTLAAYRAVVGGTVRHAA
ncbi:MAG: glycosyltransferase family 1 protein [Planctomycetia bacterium]|nr:glycosyltransferase family 1 protein [Planctomycetia bacterium]